MRKSIRCELLNSVQDGEKWKLVPDDRLIAIDLTANSPAVIATLKVGQPSGMAVDRGQTCSGYQSC
jgi:hypothetical protein